jgi:transcriptional regulator with XRE-family HTH domain
MIIMIKNTENIVQLGSNICESRKSIGITQVELASVLGINKRTLCSYEKGLRRVPIDLLPSIASTLKVSVDQLLGLQTLDIDGRSSDAKLMKRFQKISSLPEDDKKTIVHIIDTLLAKAK